MNRPRHSTPRAASIKLAIKLKPAAVASDEFAS